MDAHARAEAWRAFNEWEAGQPVPDLPFEDALRWLESCLAIARADGGPAPEPIERKTARLARIRSALAAIRR